MNEWNMIQTERCLLLSPLNRNSIKSRIIFILCTNEHPSSIYQSPPSSHRSMSISCPQPHLSPVKHSHVGGSELPVDGDLWEELGALLPPADAHVGVLSPRLRVARQVEVDVVETTVGRGTDTKPSNTAVV